MNPIKSYSTRVRGLIIAILLLASTFAASEVLAWVHTGAYLATSSGGTTVTYGYRWGNNLDNCSTCLWRTAFNQARSDWDGTPTKLSFAYDSSSPNTFNTYYSQDTFRGKATWAPATGLISYCYAMGNTFYPSNSTEMRSTANHEIGHCTGLDHSNVADAVMRAGRDRNAIYTPRQDDINGVNARYGPPCNPTCPQRVDPSLVSATSTNGVSNGSNGDPVFAATLEEHVQGAPLIVIGEVVGVGEIVNMARNVNDVSQPDPTHLVLGQVYQVEVERYLKGSGSTRISVVQAEGFVVGDGVPVPLPQTSEEVARAKEGEPYVPMQPGSRYLFFVEHLNGFDADYMTGTAQPWRFTLPQEGLAEPQSAFAEANQPLASLTSAQLIERVVELLNGQD